MGVNSVCCAQVSTRVIRNYRVPIAHEVADLDAHSATPEPQVNDADFSVLALALANVRLRFAKRIRDLLLRYARYFTRFDEP